MSRSLPEVIVFVGQLNFIATVNKKNSRFTNLISSLLTIQKDGNGARQRKLVVFMHRKFEDRLPGIYEVVVIKNPQDSFGIAILREEYILPSANVGLGEQVLENRDVSAEEADKIVPEEISLRDFILGGKRLFPIADIFYLETAVQQSNWPEVRARILRTYPKRKLTDELSAWFSRLVYNAHVVRRLVEETPVTPLNGSKEDAEIGSSAT